MAPFPKPQDRRRRYARQAVPARITLTPTKISLLHYLAELRIASLPQLASLVCPSQKAARRHLREVFDAGLVDVIPMARFALADPRAETDASLLFGSAPNIYTLTRAGGRVLQELGLVEELPRATRYGPRNSLFLAHELGIRDIRVWLERTARSQAGLKLATWRDSGEAEILLPGREPPRVVRPDAWFTFQIGRAILVGLMELDRGTERVGLRWREKLAAYKALMSSGRLQEVTGYVNARVLVIAPDARRRDALAEFIGRESVPSLTSRFWLTERGALTEPGLDQSVWIQPGSQLPKPLVPRVTL